MPTTRKTLALGLTGLFLFGCDAKEAEMSSASEDRAAPAKMARSDAKAESKSASKDASAAPPASVAPAEAGEAAPAGAKADAAEGDYRAADDDRRAERPSQTPVPRAGQLTAGRWSDRDDWSRWQQLLSPGSSYGSMLDAWNVGRTQRVAISLRGNSSVPADASLILTDTRGRPVWRARTDNQGRADLYLPPGGSGQLTVRGADGRTLATRQVKAGEEHQLRIGEDLPVASALDLMFVVDTTGSMGDELSYLQTELSDIVARVQRNARQELTVRTSVNFYKDTTDDYVVRSYPFTADIQQSLRWLRSEHASGGGDYPEALDDALTDAVDGHDWSDSAVARIMFVITDAPPHSGYDVGQRLEKAAASAAEQGIRIVPIASSGVDKPTEFMLRHLAVSTGGTYVFLTDHSGIGGSHIEPTVGPHVVAPLNDLLVEVIEEYTQTEELQVVAAAPVASATPGPRNGHDTHGHHAHRHRYEGHGGTGWAWVYGLATLIGLAIPAGFLGFVWSRSRRALPPIADARIARARRMLAELSSRAGRAHDGDVRSWVTQTQEVVEGIEQLARQRQAIDASLRVTGEPQQADPTGMRASLRAEVTRRCQAIDAEIDAGLVSVEAAYLHVIGGVGERSATQANLDAAREALQSRIEIERELRLGH